MNSTVSLLKVSAAELNMSPQAIIKSAGFSKNNWFNWIGKKNQPSKHMAEEIIKTVQRLRVEKGLTQETAPQSTQVVPFASPRITILNLDPQRLREALAEQRANLEKQRAVVGALEVLATVS
jgi:hypothetical protein